MDLYEYQARSLLADSAIPVHGSCCVQNLAEVDSLLQSGAVDFPAVVKAQVKVGGRGKAGGVKLAKSAEELRNACEQILGMDIKGHAVRQVMITQAAQILEEYYASITFDRSANDYVLLLSKFGGVEIEELAVQRPHDLHSIHFSPLIGLTHEIAQEAVQKAGFGIDVAAQTADEVAQILVQMWNCYVNFDATLVEINPLAKITTADNSTAVYALDAKISLDENAKFRHDEYFNEFADEAASDPLERRAGELGLNYVRLDGEIGVIGNGAGLVMSSLDVVKLAGEEFGGVKPANFLDIGGGASSEVMKNSLELVTSDPNVQAILVNIFGGLTQCDLVAEGILQAMHALENESVVLKQIVVRFDGNARDAGVKILQQANRPEIEVTTSMKDAAERVAKRAWQKQTSAQNQAKEVQS